MDEILKTKEYDKFSFITGNRPISKPFLGSLMKSMEEKYIPQPAQVNEKHEVVEGQHRLESCKILKLEYYYQVIEGLTLMDVARINSNRRNWNYLDYLGSYIALDKNPDYKMFKWFMEKYGFDYWSSLFLLCGVSGRSTLQREFYEGRLKIEYLKDAIKRADKIYQVKPYYDGFMTSQGHVRRYFVQAMIRVFADPEYNHKRFLGKLKISRSKLFDCTLVSDYLSCIDNVYNHNVTKQNRVRFKIRALDVW